jgi:hypothetical protein
LSITRLHDLFFIHLARHNHSSLATSVPNNSKLKTQNKMPPQQQSNSSIDDTGNEFLKPAATTKFGRCPNLVKAVSSQYPSPLPFKLGLMARMMMLIVPSLFYVGPLMLSAPMFLFLVYPNAAISLLIIDAVLAFYPVKQWPFFRRYFQLWYDLFDFHHNIALPLDPTTQKVEETSLLIYATHPHGVIPIHGYLWCAFCDQHFPERYGFGALTDIAMRLPLLRQVMGWLSSTSASKGVLIERMNAGENLYLLPGGVAEIFLACPGRHVIKAPRNSLMKLSLQTGAVLVPIYVFGANDFYSQLATCDMSPTSKKGKSSCSSSDPTNLIGRVQRALSRKAKGGFTLFWGQYGLPVPYEARCSMVLGDPIEPVPGTLGQERSGNKMTCKKVAEPTEEQIDELLYRYTYALVSLFEQYKTQAGCPEAELILQ